MIMKKCMSKYDFTPDMADTKIDYSELVTVPDQVLSMYDIYMKYAVHGEIAGLANNIRPHVHDDLDMFDESVDFVPEEDLDVLQRSRALRMVNDAEASSSAHPAAEDIPVAEGVDKESDSSPAKPEKPASPDAGSE